MLLAVSAILTISVAPGKQVLFGLIMWRHRETLTRLQRSEVRTELNKRATELRKNSKDLGQVLMHGQWLVTELPAKASKNFDAQLQQWAAQCVQREYMRHRMRLRARNIPFLPPKPVAKDADTNAAWGALAITCAVKRHAFRWRRKSRRGLLTERPPPRPHTTAEVFANQKKAPAPSTLVLQEGRLAWFASKGVAPKGRDHVWFGANTGVAKGALWLSPSSIAWTVEGTHAHTGLRFCAMAVMASPIADHTKGYRMRRSLHLRTPFPGAVLNHL